jgi:hypothetical protein
MRVRAQNDYKLISHLYSRDYGQLNREEGVENKKKNLFQRAATAPDRNHRLRLLVPELQTQVSCQNTANLSNCFLTQLQAHVVACARPHLN